MKSRFPSLVLLLSLVAILTVQCGVIRPTPDPEVCAAVDRGLAFLKARYNPTLGLLNESPTAAPHTYWLTNDNAVAAYVFDHLGQAELGTALHASLQRYGFETNGLIEVLWGVPVTFPPYVARQVLIATVGEDEIWQEFHINGDRFEDWAGYADLSFWGALNASQQGRRTEALDTFARAMSLFDGVGFKDSAFKGQYETYKLALALYVGTAIGMPDTNADRLRTTLRGMQSADGGFFTHYSEPATAQRRYQHGNNRPGAAGVEGWVPPLKPAKWPGPTAPDLEVQLTYGLHGLESPIQSRTRARQGRPGSRQRRPGQGLCPPGSRDRHRGVPAPAGAAPPRPERSSGWRIYSTCRGLRRVHRKLPGTCCCKSTRTSPCPFLSIWSPKQNSWSGNWG